MRAGELVDERVQPAGVRCGVDGLPPLPAGTTGGAPVLAEMAAHGVVGRPATISAVPAARAIFRAPDRAGLRVDQVDLFEINEVFASGG